ncbi:sugar phosphate isomerase/epimerase family protein [Halorhabdus amylolytica]|uniref:sugar phosphate isomerase/epimerase family protein n=1 Tax=Halorhabdus amylolytica TaxID=2559573 RepID=UPI0010AA0F9E|nr:sugar phosphate isomerase/epimerase family protein [Halorhabdus amylolytica]
MRLGVNADVGGNDPDSWIDALDDGGYRTAPAPIDSDADAETVADYRETAAAAGVEIAEVGAWGSNPISDDSDERERAIDACARHLELAEELGATCCVNVAGSRGDAWDGPHSANFSAETFDRIVESVREIIDRVEPTRTVYTLEPMPSVPPHSIESQRRLLEAVDREAFGVHFDPVNMLTSPERVAHNAEFVREFVEAFAADIAVVHLKDAIVRHELTVHIDEVVPGDGEFDIHTLLSALDDHGLDVPILLEHLESETAYERATTHVRDVAADVGVSL